MMCHVDKDQNVSFSKGLQDHLVRLFQLQTILEPVDLHVIIVHLHTEDSVLTLHDLQLPRKFTNNSPCKVELMNLRDMNKL